MGLMQRAGSSRGARRPTLATTENDAGATGPPWGRRSGSAANAKLQSLSLDPRYVSGGTGNATSTAGSPVVESRVIESTALTCVGSEDGFRVDFPGTTSAVAITL